MFVNLFAVLAVNSGLKSRLRSSRGVAGAVLLMLLSSCAGMPGSESLQESLSADPSLQTPPPIATTATPSPGSTPPTDTTTPPTDSSSSTITTSSVLPENFPSTLPQYPGATLIGAVTSEPNTPAPLNSPDTSSTPSELYPWQTRWETADPIATVRQFYKRELKRQTWTTEQVMLSQAESSFTIRQGNVSAIVRMTAGVGGQPTEIAIDYAIETAIETAGTKITDSSPSPAPSPQATPKPDAENAPSTDVTTFSDLVTLDAIAEPLRSSVTEVAKLGVLTAKDGDRFAPNEPATRREYVRWLFAAHNRIYAQRPSEQLRTATPESSGTIAFQDVPKSDPDFAMIQGLAEAGILPSPLNGNDATTQFLPDNPLTRETLVMWKVPLDRRRSLPTATIEALQNTWGFQDTEQIVPLALRALLVDFQNGDLSVVRRTFGYTTLFQPKKGVTRAEAAASLWYFGFQGEGRSAKTVLETEN